MGSCRFTTVFASKHGHPGFDWFRRMRQDSFTANNEPIAKRMFRVSNQSQTFDSSKTNEYLMTIDQHVVCPLTSTPLSNSCYATCMLLFGCIDGLGKLLHPSPATGAGERFKFYLETHMPQDYNAAKEPGQSHEVQTDVSTLRRYCGLRAACLRLARTLRFVLCS
jgi:hypothetical protein